MTHFLDDDFREVYLEISVEIISEEYYVNMMVAWFFATALAKQWDKTISYLPTRTMTKLPAFRDLAINGTSITNLNTFAENCSFDTILFIPDRFKLVTFRYFVDGY